MEIKSELTNKSGQIIKVVYREADPNVDLGEARLQGVHAFCFCGDKMLVVYAKNKGYWTPPGGGREPRETYQEAVVREVKEETNMRVIHQELIGYQDVYELDGRVNRQVRSFCIVEPYGEFTHDPDGDITEIKLIDPQDYKKYFDWGEIGERIMQVALGIKAKA
ncbi:MAG TPA: NUDIX hydrolase [Candidatus Paceibacterota bacterium]